ncbi:MAG: tripartite tricarboxylate transporter substrate binding protein [Betaproteobacteria bacterium]|nr:MAG: tripartite tricarboxylate transporter substrate binding protein [Betaproteobacteria bacterium]
MRGGKVKSWLAGALVALFSLAASAQGFPERPVRIVVPLPPGGSPDTIARVLAQNLQASWNQPVVVENKTGGSQNIGADAVAKSPPDGYTWLLAPDNVFVINPYIAKATSFDPLTDLVPVTEVARILFLLVVPSSLPVNSVQELIAYAKAHPGELNFGSSGSGSPQRLSAELFQLMAGIKMNHVPYKGAAPAVADLLAGRIQMWIGAANSLLPHIREGRLKLLGSTAPQRVANLADTPAVAEMLAGRIQMWIGAANSLLPHIREGRLKLLGSTAPQRLANLADTPAVAETLPGFAVDTWLGIFMPAKVPADIVKKVNAEVARVLGDPEVKAKLAPQGIELVTHSPSDLARVIREDYVKWGKLIKEADIRGE